MYSPDSQRKLPHAAMMTEEFDLRTHGTRNGDKEGLRWFGALMETKMEQHAGKHPVPWFALPASGSAQFAACMDILAAMKRCIENQDWVSVANYAMMLEVRKNLLHNRAAIPQRILNPLKEEKKLTILLREPSATYIKNLLTEIKHSEINLGDPMAYANSVTEKADFALQSLNEAEHASL